MTASKKSKSARIFSKAELSFPVRYIFSLAATALFAWLYIWTFGIRYEVNDDAILSNIISGAYGPNSQYLMIVNIVYGYIMKGISNIFPGPNWFFILNFFFAILLVAYLGALLLSRIRLPLWLIIFPAFLFAFGREMFTSFHHIRYGALYCAVGVLLIILNLGKWSPAYFFGVALCLLGSMLRFEIFIAVGGLSAPILIYEFFKSDKSKKPAIALNIALLIAVVFAFYFINEAVYNSSPSWRKYREFNGPRVELLDFRIANWDRATGLAQHGYNETDAMFIKSWMFYDPEIYPVSRISELCELIPSNSAASVARQMLSTVANAMSKAPFNIFFTLFIAVWLFFTNRDKWQVFGATLAMLLAMFAFLLWRGRYLDRLENCLIMAAVIILCLCFDKAQLPDTRAFAFSAAVLVCLSTRYLYYARGSNNSYWDAVSGAAESFDSYSEDKSRLYLVDGLLADQLNGFDVWKARPAGYFSNMVSVGSWYMYSPFEEETLAGYNVENPYADSINRDDVLFIDKVNRQIREEYYRRYYDAGIIVERVADENEGGLELFRVIKP